MYNWNFPLLVLFFVLNTIKADISLVDGREYSRERSLRFYHPDIRSLAHRNLPLRKGSLEIPVREKNRDIPILQENRREFRTETRTDQSRNVNRGFSRFQTNYVRLSSRQRQAEKTHFSRLVKSRVLSVERVDDANERRILRNSNNMRTRSDIRQINDIEERLASLNRFNEIKRDNTREVRCESGHLKNRMMRSLEDRQQVSRINRGIEKRDSSSPLRNSDDNIRKINGPQYRDGINKENRETINKYTRSDKQSDRIAPSVESRQMKRDTSSRQDIRKPRSITNENQRVENKEGRREAEVRNEHTNRYERRLNERSISRVRDLSSRSFERVRFANTEASRAMYAMEHDTQVRHNERNENHRSLHVARDVLRSLEMMNVRDNTETTVREGHVQMVRDRASRVQVRQRTIKTNIDQAYSYDRDYINRNTVARQEVRKSHPNERDARLNNNHRLTLRETERNTFRHTREFDRIRNIMGKTVRIPERNTDVRVRSINRRDSTRSAEKFRESTEILRDNTERNYLRSNDDRTSERRQQRAYTHSMRRTSFDESLIRRSNSKGEIDENTRMRQNVNRNVDRRLTTDNSANRRVSQSVIKRQIREPRLTQQLEKNKRAREYDLNFDHSMNTMRNMGNEENSSFTWQTAFYALQAIYICSIVFKIWNRTDSTKRKTWSFPWLSIPANKID
ncbi:peptidyl-prolyl cis-trans isomerase G-like [Pieris brassicae]|uniref:peptidyl-prolyl cis-trans isomerase G-like n=1 Tax=Pieris brassicae TaxID=7116 RepID=UPI001E662129|nr:peptidyl-prolyl cis-trans isomerase G-like [Pieris brassicae]